MCMRGLCEACTACKAAVQERRKSMGSAMGRPERRLASTGCAALIPSPENCHRQRRCRTPGCSRCSLLERSAPSKSRCFKPSGRVDSSAHVPVLRKAMNACIVLLTTTSSSLPLPTSTLFPSSDSTANHHSMSYDRRRDQVPRARAARQSPSAQSALPNRPPRTTPRPPPRAALPRTCARSPRDS